MILRLSEEATSLKIRNSLFADPAFSRSLHTTRLPHPKRNQKYRLKRYPIDIAFPDGKSVLNADSKVKIGMKLGAVMQAVGNQ